jgi:hypothetical protein
MKSPWKGGRPPPLPTCLRDQRGRRWGIGYQNEKYGFLGGRSEGDPFFIY